MIVAGSTERCYMSKYMSDERNNITLAEAMRCFASSVSIVSTCDADKHHYAMTATAVSSVSLDPESMLVCVNRNTLFNTIVEYLDLFCINLLTTEQIFQSINCSGGLPQDNRVNDEEWEIPDDGPALLKNAQAHIFCKKTATFTYGTHNILIGDVYRIQVRKKIDPLLYMDGRYGRFREIN